MFYVVINEIVLYFAGQVVCRIKLLVYFCRYGLEYFYICT